MTSPTARSAIAVAGLRKSFGDKVVLDGIDLQVTEGTMQSQLAATFARGDQARRQCGTGRLRCAAERRRG